MITILGLVVGSVQSPYAQDVLNQCAKWLKTYKHLLGNEIIIEIDNFAYATIFDSHIENDEVFILCGLHDGSLKMGTSKQ